MSQENRNELYQQVILEHNRHPRNFHKIEDATHSAEGYNPICGDHLTLYLKINSQDLIEDIAFEGDGCAISSASASMMTSSLKGKSLNEAISVFEAFQRLLKKETPLDKDNQALGKLTIFSGVWQYPARVKCASLCWHAMMAALDNQKNVSTE